MSDLKIQNISKEFNGNHVLNSVNIEINKGEFFSIVGPSGCGKTTLLRIIAGLEYPDEGKIYIKNTDSTNLPPQKRNIGIVFQNYALFPNMNVFENVAYGLQIKKESKEVIYEKVNSVLEKVSLNHKINHAVSTLSGGEQQRVSLARVIVTEPDLILFDEPLSNLDYSLRQETRNELKRLQSELGITSVYVTHDQTEALALSDRVAVLNKGIIEQTGNPKDIYYNPSNSFVAVFIGHSNLFDPVLCKRIFNIEINNNQTLAVLPEEIIPVKEADFKPGKITDIQFTGYTFEYTISIDGKTIKSLQSVKSVKEEFIEGEEVGISLLTFNHRVIK